MNIEFGAAILTCEPATIMLAITAASAAASGYAQYESGQSQKKAANYNAKMADMQAQDTLQRGADAGAERKQQARKMISTQTERMSGMGVSVNTGTPLGLLTETAGLGELDALTVQNNARREAWGLKSGAKLDLYQGKMAARGGALNAAGTLLGGASSAYYGYKGAK
jgi:hypothetical protein